MVDSGDQSQDGSCRCGGDCRCKRDDRSFPQDRSDEKGGVHDGHSKLMDGRSLHSHCSGSQCNQGYSSQCHLLSAH